MAIFFTLSGFLITNLLIRSPDVLPFIVRRIARIVPLAWAGLFLGSLLFHADPYELLRTGLFVANLPPIALPEWAGHFWSLQVEVQFYAFIALLFAALGSKALFVLPIMCFAITVARIQAGEPMTIVTYFRVDEILAGCLLAGVYNLADDRVKNLLGRVNPWAIIVLLMMSANPHFVWLNYARPYLAMMLVGQSVFSDRSILLSSVLRSTFLAYVASISFAVYVTHGILDKTWLGSGGAIEKYLKRPLLIAATWVLAHLSTRYFESYWIRRGKVLSERLQGRST